MTDKHAHSSDPLPPNTQIEAVAAPQKEKRPSGKNKRRIQNLAVKVLALDAWKRSVNATIFRPLNTLKGSLFFMVGFYRDLLLKQASTKDDQPPSNEELASRRRQQLTASGVYFAMFWLVFIIIHRSLSTEFSWLKQPPQILTLLIIFALFTCSLSNWYFIGQHLSRQTIDTQEGQQ